MGRPRLTTSHDVHHETRALNGLCIAGCSRSLPLPVPYLSTHGCRTVCLRGFGGRVFSGSEMQRCTNTEPGAVATGPSVDYEPRCSSRNSRIERFVYCRLQPVAAAPGSVFVDPRCQPSCVDIIATRIMNRERSGDRVHVALLPKLRVIKNIGSNTFSRVALTPTIKIGKVEFSICRYDRISHRALKDLLPGKRICDARTNTEPGAIATGWRFDYKFPCN